MDIVHRTGDTRIGIHLVIACKRQPTEHAGMKKLRTYLLKRRLRKMDQTNLYFELMGTRGV